MFCWSKSWLNHHEVKSADPSHGDQEHLVVRQQHDIVVTLSARTTKLLTKALGNCPCSLVEWECDSTQVHPTHIQCKHNWHKWLCQGAQAENCKTIWIMLVKDETSKRKEVQCKVEAHQEVIDKLTGFLTHSMQCKIGGTLKDEDQSNAWQNLTQRRSSVPRTWVVWLMDVTARLRGTIRCN